jgi:hypothetical protein
MLRIVTSTCAGAGPKISAVTRETATIFLRGQDDFRMNSKSDLMKKKRRQKSNIQHSTTGSCQRRRHRIRTTRLRARERKGTCSLKKEKGPVSPETRGAPVPIHCRRVGGRRRQWGLREEIASRLLDQNFVFRVAAPLRAAFFLFFLAWRLAGCLSGSSVVPRARHLNSATWDRAVKSQLWWFQPAAAPPPRRASFCLLETSA